MPDAPLRKDAARNRDRLLSAGRELFALRGLDATLNDVARHAGVGIGTAYRRFENKQALIDAILVQQVEELEAILTEALAQVDAWNGLVLYLTQSLSMQAKDRGISQILSGKHVQPDRHDWARDRLAPMINNIASRAVSAGVVRSDVSGTDLILLQIALSAIAIVVRDGPVLVSRDDADHLYLRYLWIALDGLRPSRASATPLPVPALTTLEVHTMLRSAPEQ